MKGGKECEDFLGVDSFRAYTAARVMTFLVFVQMNVSPWNLNVGKKITRLFGEALSQSELEKECYSFPVSCIFACLDCLCGAGGDSHLMVQLYSLIALVFTNMTALVELEGCSPAIDHLKTVAISSFTPMLIRCFKIHVNSAGAPEDFLALRLLLCSMRAIISFAAICSQKGAPGGTENAESESSANEINTGAGNAESDDLFGSLDDAAFASIDLDCFGTSNVAPLRCIKKELCLCLTDALRQSKVS